MRLSATSRRVCAGLLIAVAAVLFSSASALAVTQEFKFTGKEQEFKVPTGVTSVHVVAIGSEGGKAEHSASGGLGAVVSGDLTVKPEQALYVEVGGVPFNGGGASTAGGAGGGASDVRTVSIGAEPSPGDKASLESRLLVAAGGGGGGDANFLRLKSTCPGGLGGNAEEKGADGTNCGEKPGEGGGAGEASNGGAGGKGYVEETPNSGFDGEAGRLGVGGAGGSPEGVEDGGGGGGGVYGGGGGGLQGVESFVPEKVAGNGGGGGGIDLTPGGGTAGTAKEKEATSVTISYTPPPQTCGKTTIGKVSDQLLANQKRVNKCVLPFNAQVSELVMYLAPTSHSGEQLIKGVFYEDSKGKPGKLVGETSKFTFSSKEAAGWHHFVFLTPLKLSAGTYWMGIITGASSRVAGERFDSVKNAEDYNSNAYLSGASNPFGSFKTTNEEMSLYATFEEDRCSVLARCPG